MPFSQRNIFYLRTSAHVVLQTILYIDPRDVRWMNSSAYSDTYRGEEDDSDDDVGGIEITGDLVWARALSRLKNKIMPKLRAESIEGDILSTTNKKEKVDVHIEPDFQMAYFFRKISGKHAVLLKHKELRFPRGQSRGKKTTNGDMPPPLMPASALRQSDANDSMPASRLARREANNLDTVLMQQDLIANTSAANFEKDDIDPLKRTRPEDEMMGLPSSSDLSDRPIRIKQEDDDDIQLLDSLPLPVDPEPMEEELADQVEAIEEEAAAAEEDDKKPRLHVDYSGFKIFGKCFIVVIEPTKRTKRLRPSLFHTSKQVEVHQLSATPVPRQARETPIPSSTIQTTQDPSSRRSVSMRVNINGEDDRSDSRRDRMANGLFRGTPSDYTPTPTPEPESQARRQQPQFLASSLSEVDDDDEDEAEGSHSMMLATQMLEGGISGSGNDIDDE